MASLSSPLHVLGRFARAFRASKQGIRPEQYLAPLRSPEAFHDAVSDQLLLLPIPSKQIHRAAAKKVADAVRGTSLITKAERYGGILGRGYRADGISPRVARFKMKTAMIKDLAQTRVPGGFLAGKRIDIPFKPQIHSQKAAMVGRLFRPGMRWRKAYNMGRQGVRLDAHMNGENWSMHPYLWANRLGYRRRPKEL